MEKKREQAAMEKNLDVSFGELGPSGRARAEQSQYLPDQGTGAKDPGSYNSRSSGWQKEDSAGHSL